MQAFLFPGQGSQYPGMGKEIFSHFSTAKEVFQEVDDVLSQKLSSLMFDGDESELMKTQNTQPALMAVSIALMRVLERDMKIDLKSQIHFAAGHSLGEYTALCATGVFSLASTARLLRARGLAMQEAVPLGVGGMAALIGATLEQGEDVARQATSGTSVCEVANDNAPGQIVLSGHKDAIERAIDIAGSMGIKRAIVLPVSAPFHSSLMQPAVAKMQASLDKEEILGMPSVSLVSNVTASPLETADQIIPRLLDQMTGRVRWVESMMYLVDHGVTEVIEVGAGKVLSGLMRRIHKDTTCTNIETLADLDLFTQKAA